MLQVNGRVRDKALVPVDATEEKLKALALANEKVREILAGKQIRKVIVVPKRLVNIVAS